MWIKRDISSNLESNKHQAAQIIVGPRQCGKSSLLWKIGQEQYSSVTFDDLHLRNLAQNDPSFFLSQKKLPLILDEIQYVPNLFPEIKKIIDELKLEFIKTNKKIETVFRLTGSNQILLDKNVKESLIGRGSYYYLNTLTVAEIKNAFQDMPIQEIIYKGGWPELYTIKQPAVNYLNDYIRSFIEKDVVLSAGIEKQREFHTVLGMLAARTGELLNYSNIAQNSGVKSVTVKEWVSVLERSHLLYLLMPLESNLNKRLSKSPKLYFLDTGLACRLQGWRAIETMMLSPQSGHLFETLVMSEIIKTKQNFNKDWKVSLFRTRDDDEVDFIIEKENNEIIAIDAKLGIHQVGPAQLPKALNKIFPQLEKLTIVSLGGERKMLSEFCEQVPIEELKNYLLEEKIGIIREE